MRYALDVDGVLLNWYKHTMRLLGYPYRRYLPKWRVPEVGKHWKRIEGDKRFWENIEALSSPDSLPPVTCYITALPEQWKKAREENLRQLGFPEAPVVVSRDKLKTCLEYDITHYVDDAPKNIIPFLSTDIEVFQFYPHYAAWEKVGPIITNLKQFR